MTLSVRTLGIIDDPFNLRPASDRHESPCHQAAHAWLLTCPNWWHAVWKSALQPDHLHIEPLNCRKPEKAEQSVRNPPASIAPQVASHLWHHCLPMLHQPHSLPCDALAHRVKIYRPLFETILPTKSLTAMLTLHN